MAFKARTQPLPLTTTVTGSSTTRSSATARLSAWINVRRSSAVGLDVGFDLLDQQTLERRRAAQDVVELVRSSPSAASSCSILMASSRASWRKRISRMSSAWRSEQRKARDQCGLRLVRPRG